MSGTMIQLFVDGATDELGAEAVARARASLPEETRRTLEHITAVSWVPIAMVEELIEALADAGGLSVNVLRQRVVPPATRKGFHGVWRALLRFTGAEALIRRTPKIYARGRNVGKLEVTEVGHGVAELALTGWPDVPEGQLQSVALSIQTILRMSGRPRAVVSWRSEPGGGGFTVRWLDD